MSMNMSLKQANEMELARFALNGVDEDVLMDGTALELDKSWHVLHFLFTGHPSHGPMPAAALLSGGREIGDDLGYGPALRGGDESVRAVPRRPDGGGACRAHRRGHHGAAWYLCGR